MSDLYESGATHDDQLHGHATPRGRRPRGPYLQAVRDAWQNAWQRQAEYCPRLDLALRAFARDGRARGLGIGSLLRELDSLVRPHEGGDHALATGGMREWAGTQLIRAYYRDD